MQFTTNLPAVGREHKGKCQNKGHKEYIFGVPCLPAGRFVLNFVCFVLT
jgi:hypothetical protein